MTGKTVETVESGRVEPGTVESGRSATEARTVPAGAFVIAVMVAMALGVLAVVALTLDSGGTGGDDQDTEVRLAAGRFTERFLSFEHDALDEWKSGVLELATIGFAGEVDDAESGLRRLIENDEIDARPQITEVFLGEVDRDVVKVVVLYDWEIQGSDGRRVQRDRYLQLTLLELDGQWLADDVVDILFLDGSSDNGG